jgi:uncharacterized protein involved in type VI secretion and phage assembly
MSQRIASLVIGKVQDLEDPEGLGRVRLTFPVSSGSDDVLSNWAPIVRPLASGGFGLWAPPRDGDLVLVGFEYGSVSRPYVLGAIWNGSAQPPTTDNEQVVFKTAAGHTLTLNDKSGEESVKVEDKAGNVVQLDKDGVVITSAKDIKITGQNITIEASAQLTAKGAPIHLNP